MTKNTVSFISDHTSETSNQQPAEARGKATWPESILLVIIFPRARESIIKLRDSELPVFPKWDTILDTGQAG